MKINKHLQRRLSYEIDLITQKARSVESLLEGTKYEKRAATITIKILNLLDDINHE